MFEQLFSHRGLSLDRLRALLEVHEAGSIAQTAPGNAVRHSQYSRQLRELSEFFGCEVAERRGKLVKLTPEGLRLAELSREYLRGLEDFADECHREQALYTIAAGDSLIQWLVIPRLGSVMRQMPSVRFATESSRTHEVVQKVSEWRVDFGIVRKNAVLPEFKATSLGSLRYVAVVPTALVPEKRSMSLRDVFALPVALQTTEGEFSRQLLEIARALKPDFQPALSCQSFPQTASAVTSGAFAAILPELVATQLNPMHIHYVSSPALNPLRRHNYLVWNRRTSGVRPLTTTVAEELQRTLRLPS